MIGLGSLVRAFLFFLVLPTPRSVLGPGFLLVCWLFFRPADPPTQYGAMVWVIGPLNRGRCLAENAYQKRKQNNVHHKGKKTKHTVLCYCVSSQLTLAAARVGAEEGVGRTTKTKTNTKNLQSRASV